MKFHQPGPSSLSTLDLNANVNIGCRRHTGDDISSSVLCTGELKIAELALNNNHSLAPYFIIKVLTFSGVHFNYISDLID